MARRSTLTVIAVAGLAFVVFIGLFLIVATLLGDGAGLSLGGDRIAVIEIEGLITDDEEVIERIHELREDESVRGFVIEINSPGGVVGPSQSIYRELSKLAAADERPLVASIGAVGASGGYYVALAADSIFALPGSLTGSIGVIMQFPNVTELMDKIGVQMNIVKSAEYKDLGSPFVPLADQDRSVLDNLVENVYDQFVTVVASERGLPRDSVLAIADGRIYTGQQALALGLVDRMGNLPAAIAAAGRMAGLGPDPAVDRPPEEDPSITDVLLGGAARNVLSSVVAPLKRTAAPRLLFIAH